MNIIQKINTAAILLCLSTVPALAKTSIQTPGAFFYDAIYPDGPNSKQNADPGHWISHLLNFNNQATNAAQIKRLYPYGGSIEMYCSSPLDCVFSGPQQNVFIYYRSPASGQASVAAYRASFVNAKIFANIDGHTNSDLLKPLTYAAIGKATANALANTICSDPNVDGVIYDLEPFNNSSAGQMALFKQTAARFAASKCIDSKHPTGRTFGVFLNPNKITNWSGMAASLGRNGFLVVSGYDLGDTTTPPSPISVAAYKSALKNMITNMDSKSTQYKIAYTVAIPAAASFSEFTQFGYYDASNPPSNFRLDTNYEPAITQLGYTQAAIDVISSTSKSAYYLGTDYWGWGQYKSPNPAAGQLLMPNIPMGDVVTYLSGL